MSRVVYQLVGRDGEVRYVGLTRNPQRRLRFHKYARTPLGEWVRQQEARIEVLEETGAWPTPRPWSIERRWIEQRRAEGHVLFNIWPVKRPA